MGCSTGCNVGTTDIIVLLLVSLDNLGVGVGRGLELELGRLMVLQGRKFDVQVSDDDI